MNNPTHEKGVQIIARVLAACSHPTLTPRDHETNARVLLVDLIMADVIPNQYDPADAIGCANALHMARTRELLARSSYHRQRAVAEFPLVVANIAKDMLRILDTIPLSANQPNTKQTLDYIEEKIREVYREKFGSELGQ